MTSIVPDRMRSLLASAAVSSVFGLLAGGAGWMVHSLVDSGSARALFGEQLAEHDRELERHDRIIAEIPDLKVLMAEVAANQRSLAELVERMDRQRQVDVADMRDRTRR